MPERTALAKELRGRGERAEAARVAKLVKPSVPAWAVNQLVRTQGSAMRDLFAAGEGLRAAQSEVVSGRGSAQGLRDAGERERAAVATLAEAAGELATGTGRSLGSAPLERVSETLHAAALDDDARRAVADGCLTRELRHVGLGDVFGAEPGGPEADDQAAQQRAARLESAQRREREARDAAEGAAHAVERAQGRQMAAAEALAEAEAALGIARRQAKETEQAHRDAQQAIERL